jgi:hypothetical protein
VCVCVSGEGGGGVQQLITVSRSNIFSVVFKQALLSCIGERINRRSPGSHVADIYLADAGHCCQVPPIFFIHFKTEGFVYVALQLPMSI